MFLMNYPVFKNDCILFRGDIPCKPHKLKGFHCESCEEYNPKKERILIIKLGAIGDVIRTTPLLHRIWKEMPQCEVWWLTLSPEIVTKRVDKVFDFSLESLLVLQNSHFNILINLDKDNYACALANSIDADKKYGFTLDNGKPAPANELAYHKFMTGIFDDVNKNNTKSYMEEMFEIVGWQFAGEEYILDLDDGLIIDIPNNKKQIIGLNTGCGARWTSRLWSDDNWIELIKLLQNQNYFPLLLGGKQEDDKNKYFSKATDAFYPGAFPFSEFVSLMNKCHTVVTAVTMGLHIAIALKKNIVLMNNIFNPNEFELYGRGVIVGPEKECKCFFSPKCKNDEYFCMDYISANNIMKAVESFSQ